MNRFQLLGKTAKLLPKILLLALVFTILPLALQAAPPQKINYQGYVTSVDGTPVNTYVDMTLSLYDTKTGGIPLWREIQSVQVTEGQYSVNLGEVAPLNLPFDKTYYLGIRINFDKEITPRQLLSSSSYTFKPAMPEKGDLPTASSGASAVKTGTIDAYLVGTWNFIANPRSGTAETGVITYYSDGTYSVESGSSSLFGISPQTGKWKSLQENVIQTQFDGTRIDGTQYPFTHLMVVSMISSKIVLEYSGNVTVLNNTTMTTSAGTTTTTAAETTTTTAAEITTTTTATTTTTTLDTSFVPVAGAGSSDAGNGNITYNISAGNYNHTIYGFGVGDTLLFPAGNTPTINNGNFTDGIVDVQWASGGQTVTIHLTGIPAAQDGTIFGRNSFKSVFGSSSLQP